MRTVTYVRTALKSFSGKSKTRFLAGAMLALAFVGGNAYAQETGSGRDSSSLAVTDQEIVKQLLRRIEDLEVQVRELKAGQAKLAAATLTSNSVQTPPAVQQAALTKPATQSPTEQRETQDGMPQTTRDGLPPGLPTLQVRGFADMEFRASDQRGEKTAFLLGQFDLFITSRLSDKLSVLSEVVIENGPANRFWIDIERLLVQYTPRDYFNLSIGRYHTGIGFYNTAYHHGAWFETATGRPFVFAFEDEGGMLPIHNVGLSANGRIPSGPLRLGYILEVGNGRRSPGLGNEPVQNVADEDNHKAVNLGLIAKPEWLPGLQAGVSVYRDRFQPQGSPAISQTIAAFHVVYQDPKFEFLNEVLVLRNALAGSRVFNTPAFYTQVSRQFRDARPYFRYDYVNAPTGDLLFGAMGRRNGPSAGLRYDVSEFAALKAEYKHIGRRQTSSVNGMTLQLAFTF